MTYKNSYSLAIGLFISLPIIFCFLKYQQQPNSLVDFLPEIAYNVNYQFSLKSEKDSIFLKAFLPENSVRQSIENKQSSGDFFHFEEQKNDFWSRGKWLLNAPKGSHLSYQFSFRGKKIQYEIADDLPLINDSLHNNQEFLNPSEHIQSNHDSIILLANQLSRSNLKETLQANFDFLFKMPKTKTAELTDALTALQQNHASCNGKSRLFVALCRAQGLPSRVVGGIILENTTKKTSHLWAEVLVQDYWIPFDVLNGHFATLPANYLQLYQGDEFLITHTPDIEFDYNFVIEKQRIFPKEKVTAGFNLWSLANQEGVSFSILRSILLLPLATLIVALLRNIIGIKTFGVFLPALIALSFVNVGIIWGIVSFILVVLVVNLLHFPMEKWGLLYTPKLVVILTGVVVSLLLFSYLGLELNWTSLAAVLFFPVVILSITAERFARTIAEEGFTDALQLLGQTLIVTLCCFPIFSSKVLVGVFLSFPELYALIIGLMLLLGRWIGLRISEYRRFAWLG